MVLSHLGLDAIGGGYAGVDIFFVISGYIISGDLIARMRAGTASPRDFYMRRIRRLLPNLVVMSVAVLAAGAFVFLPDDLARLPWRTLASQLGVSNWLFAYQSGYFLPASSWNPLLHTWTLAVEFQFYVVAPFLIMAIARFGERALRGAIMIAGGASLVYAQLSNAADNPWHFYDSLGRAWEFLLGVAINLWRLPPMRRRYAEGLCAVALMLLIASFVSFDRDGGFPDLRTLVPTFSTAALIALLPSATTVRHLLSGATIRRLGQESYSIYIWHWPIIVFAHYLFPGLSEGSLGPLLLLGPILLVSTLAFRWIETPYRSPRTVSDQRLWVLLGAAMLFTIIACMIIKASEGWPSRFARREAAILAAQSMVSSHRETCHRSDLALPLTRSCRFGAQTAPTIAMWSDSHGIEILDQMGAGLAASGLSAVQLSFSSCPPRRPSRLSGDCSRFNHAALTHLLAQPQIDTVILAGALDSDAHRLDGSWAKESRGAARALLRAGKRVVLVYPIPRQAFHVPRAMVNHLRFGIAFAGAQSDRDAYLTRNIATFAVLDGIEGAGVLRVYPHQTLCASGTCLAARGGVPLYYDDNHLLLPGAAPISQTILEILARD